MTREADVFVPELFGSLDALGIAMALRALDSPPLSPIVAKSLVALVRDLYD